MTLRGKIEVMEAFERGEYVEVRTDKTKSGTWSVAVDPIWDWNNNDYRIKPKPKQVIAIEKWLCKGVDNEYYIVEGFANQLRKYEGNKVKLLDTYEVEI